MTSSGPCPIHKPWAISYRLSIETIPLSFVWWRHQWSHKTWINYPWGPYTIQKNLELKYRPIPTRIAGEEASQRKIMTSPLWGHPVTWRHQEHAQSIAHRQVPIGRPLEPSHYLASFTRYLTPKLRTDTMTERMTERQTDTWTNYKGR